MGPVFELAAKIVLDKKEYDEGLKDAASEGESFGSKLGKGIGKGVKVLGKAVAAAAATAAAGAIAIGKQALAGYAAYEQLVGGVETLFGAGGKSFREFVNESGLALDEATRQYSTLQKSQNTVLENAANAYKTAGMSANEYMETVTGFSASLIQSLGGDTYKAAKYADMAIRDMSDNANKMGTDMSAIQVAYQGFAKQNYTMLDNLKLGYGGTKTEMERLIADAEALDSSFVATRDANGDLAMSYADIVDAIHIVQTEMGITGTTAKEASSTIEGSTKAAKAAWQNLIVGLADDNADLEDLIDNFIDSVITAGENILPRIGKIMNGVGKLISTAVKTIFPAVIKTIISNLPQIVQGGVELLMAVVTGLIEAIPQLIAAIPEIISAIITGFQNAWPQLKAAGEQLLTMIRDGIMEKVGPLLEEWKGKLDNIKQMCTEAWENIKASASSIWESLKTKVSTIVDGLKSKVSTTWNNIKTSVVNAANALKTGVSTAWTTMKAKVESVVSGIKSKIDTMKAAFDSAKEKVREAIDKIKGFLNFDWEIPKIKLPHFTVTGKLDLLAVPPQIPKLDVLWYKKAYTNPFMFTKPTIVAGFGDGNGGEMVYGHDNLMNDIREAVGSGTVINNTVNVYPQKGQSEEEIARAVERIFVRWNRQRKVALA